LIFLVIRASRIFVVYRRSGKADRPLAGSSCLVTKRGIVECGDRGGPLVIVLVGVSDCEEKFCWFVLQELLLVLLPLDMQLVWGKSTKVDSLDRIGYFVVVYDRVGAFGATPHAARWSTPPGITYTQLRFLAVPRRVSSCVLSTTFKNRAADPVTIAVLRTSGAAAARSFVARETFANASFAIAKTFVAALAIKVCFVPSSRPCFTRVTVLGESHFTYVTRDVVDPLDLEVGCWTEASVGFQCAIAIKITPGRIDKRTPESADSLTTIRAHPVVITRAMT